MSDGARKAGLPEGSRILLTGGSGQVGRALQQTLASLGEVVAPTRAEMDLQNAQSVRDAIRRVRPRWIVNPGAYTAVDMAESEPDVAYAVNATAVEVMAEEALAIKAGVLHFSTDYVFDGTKPAPYVETDSTGPTSVYGRTKLDGEKRLQESGAAHAIFRTSWVFGATGKNFVLSILKLARERETLRIVADQHGSPTWSFDLARLAAHFAGLCEGRAHGGDVTEPVRELGGIYHAAGRGYTTWYEFAGEAVAAARRREPASRYADLVPITTAEYPTPARRPANSRLNCARLEDRLGWRMMDWRESLAAVVG